MTRVPRRLPVLLAASALLLAACVAFPVDAAAKRKSPAPKLKFVLPGPGHVTILAGNLKIKTKHPKDWPRRARVAFPKAKKLPSDVRVTWATRAIRKKRSVTYAVIVTAVRKAGAKGSARARAADDAAAQLIVQQKCKGCGKWTDIRQLKKKGALCHQCHKWKATNDAKMLLNADQAQASELPSIQKLLKETWTKNGNSDPIFDPLKAGKLIVTGQFKHGAFSWHVEQDGVDELEHHVIDDVLKGEQAQLLPALEAHAGVDLNGDGTTRDPRCEAGTSELFGRQQITTPPHGQVAFYYFIPFSPIPRWTYYWVHYGVKTAGCNLDDDSLEVNLEVRSDSGALISWDYQYEPYPSTPDGPKAFHSGTYCPGNETPKPRNHCEIGGLALGVPPEDEGHFGGWPQPPGRDEYYWFIFGVGERGDPNTATVRGKVSWRPTPD